MQPTNFNIISFNRCIWPSGKVMGGSSSINYMLYVRGNRRDYDRWAEMGNTGWSYEDVLPYFIKSEDNKNPKYAGTKYHGIGGYLTVGEAPYKTPLAEAFIKAGEELGYEERDGNGEFQTGTYIISVDASLLKKRVKNVFSFEKGLQSEKTSLFSLFNDNI